MAPPGEAVTMATDYVLALFALGAAAWLVRSSRGAPGRWWAAGFAATALAALLGGTSHGYAPVLARSTHDWVWRLTYVMVGVANLCVMYGAACAALPRRLHAAALAVLAARFVAVSAVLVARDDFRYVLYDYAITLAALVALVIVLARRRAPGGGWVALGIVASMVGALVQLERIGLGHGFNHNDLFHVIQSVGILLYARGGRELETAPPA